MPRRQFFKCGGALVASSLAVPSILSTGTRGSEKLRIAVIGVGGRGRSHVQEYQEESIVAFCDVDERRAGEIYAKFSHVPRFKDYRVMFDKMGKDFDAVSIATPDHMHFPVAKWALAHGKHILVEKPLVRTFEEAMILKRMAKDAGVITQMGNQGHASDGLRVIQEWMAAGLIGKVQETYHCTDRPVWPQGLQAYPPKAPIPSSLDWNLWQGVAPEMAYRDGIVPINWRGFRNYGSGAIGDMGCHLMDVAFAALKLGFPVGVRASSSGMTEVAFPKSSVITFDFLLPDSLRPIKMHWYDGGQMPEEIPFVSEGRIPFFSRGLEQNHSYIVGSKGTISCDMYCRQPRIFPRDYFRELRKDRALPAKRLQRVKGGHFKEWVNCVKEGTQAGSNIVDYSADFTASTLLGKVALETETPLDFDPNTKRFVNNATANDFLKSQYPYRAEFLPG